MNIKSQILLGTIKISDISETAKNYINKKIITPVMNTNTPYNLKHTKPELKNETRKKSTSWLTENERQKWKQEWEEKAKAANEFSKKMKLIQDHIKKREEESNRKLITKIEQKLLNRDVTRLSKSLLKPSKNESEEIKIEAREKSKQCKKLQNFQQTPIKKRYLYERMYERYITEVELPELEKRKQNLEKKRNAYHPIRKQELDEHERKYVEIIEKYNENHRKELQKRQIDSEEYKLKVEMDYESSFMKKALEKDRKFKLKSKIEKQKIKQNYIKKMTYSRIVKDSYFPEISTEKVTELREKINNLKHPVRKPKEKYCKKHNDYSLNSDLLNLRAEKPKYKQKANISYESPNYENPEIDQLAKKYNINTTENKHTLLNEETLKSIPIKNEIKYSINLENSKYLSQKIKKPYEYVDDIKAKLSLLDMV